MVSLIYVDDRMQLLSAIERCRKVQIDKNDGDLYSAEMWCEYLEHKTSKNFYFMLSGRISRNIGENIFRYNTDTTNENTD